MILLRMELSTASLKKQFFLSFCMVMATLFFAMPAQAEIEDELSFETSDSFGAVDSSLEAPHQIFPSKAV